MLLRFIKIYTMNVVFVALGTLSLAILLFTNPSGALGSFMQGAENSLKLSVTLFCSYAFWLSVIKILERGGALKSIKKILNPLTKRVFPGENDETLTHVSANFAANLIGAGGAATPEGLKAAKNMKNAKNIVMLVTLNSSSLQLIPTTVVALRSSLNAAADIILPSLICSAVTTVAAFALTKVFAK